MPSSATSNSANDYSGTTTVAQGKLVVPADHVLGSTAKGTTVQAGAEIDFQNVNYATAENITINGTGVSGVGALSNVAGSSSFSGILTLGSNSTIGAAGGTTLTITNAGNVDLASSDLTVTDAGNVIINAHIGGAGDGSGGLVAGLVGAYFAPAQIPGGNANDTLLPGGANYLKNLTPTVTASTPQINFATIDTTSFNPIANVGGVNVAARWTGYLYISVAGTYTFRSSSDDGSVIILDGNTIVNNAGPHGAPGPNPNSAPIALTVGYHPIEIDMWQGGGGASIVVSYDNGGGMQVIPASAFFTVQNSVSKNGTGTLTLAGNNTYAGFTAVNQGTLIAASNNALGATASGTTVASGATLALQNNVNIPAEALSLSGTGAGGAGALESISGNNSYAGAITVVADSTINSATANNTLTISGNVSSNFGLTVTGAGNTTITGVLSGVVALPGLLEGRVNSGGIDTTTPNPGGLVELQPTMGENFVANTGASQPQANHIWGSNETWIYTGQIFTSTGFLAFAESIDDNTWVKLDGTVVLNDGSWNTTTASGSLNVGIGWHDIEIRFFNGGGGAGATVDGTNGWTNTFGFGYSIANNLTINDKTANLYTVPSSPNLRVAVGNNSLTKNGTGTLTLTNQNNSYEGPTTINQGQLVVTADHALGATSAGTQVNAGAILGFSNVNYATAEPVILNGGTISGLTGTSSFAGPISLIANSFVDAAASAALSLNGVISGSFGLTKTGAGTDTLGSIETYTGATLVNAGTLLVTGTLLPVAQVTVNNGGTLGGTGSIGALGGTMSAASGGTVDPGLAAGTTGTLNSGSVGFNAGSTYHVDINSAALFDQLNVTGLVALAGNLNVTLNGGFNPVLNQTFVIVNNDGNDAVVGTFNGLAEGGFVVLGNIAFTITYQGGSGNDVVLTRTTPPPIATNDSYNVGFNTPLTINAPGVLGNDTDPAGLAMTAQKVTDPSKGVVTLNGNGSFTYTPNTGSFGPDSFTYQVVDTANHTSNIATVTFTIANPPPIANNDNYFVVFNTPLTVNAATGVLSNDTDPLGFTMTAVKLTNPAKGTVTLNANGSFTYTPNTGTFGADSFTYRVTDSDGGVSNVATVTFLVSQPPTAVNNSYTASFGVPLNVTAPGVLGNDTDPQGLALTAILVTSPTKGTFTFNSDGSFVYTPTSTGTDTFTYRARNSAGLTSNIATVTITTGKANTAAATPTVTPANPTFGQPLTITTTVATVPAGGTPTGQVRFVFTGPKPIATQTVNLVGNTATITVLNVPAGANYKVTARYLGNAGNNASPISAAQTFSVAKAAPSLSNVTATPTLQQVVLKVNVISPNGGTPTGQVQFTVNGPTGPKTYLATVVNGVASVTVTGLPLGSYTVTGVQYLGDANFTTAVFAPNLAFDITTPGSVGRRH